MGKGTKRLLLQLNRLKTISPNLEETKCWLNKRERLLNEYVAELKNRETKLAVLENKLMIKDDILNK